jgi:hypothetical protein
MSKLNCKIGDLAIVVSAELPQNIGYIVEVIGIHTDKPLLLERPGHVWQVRGASGRKGLHYQFRDTGLVVQHSEGPVPDLCLRAIAGLGSLDAATEDMGVGGITHNSWVEPDTVVEVCKEAVHG